MGRGRKRNQALVHGLFTAIQFSHRQLVLRKKKSVSESECKEHYGWVEGGGGNGVREKKQLSPCLRNTNPPSSLLLIRMFGRRDEGATMTEFPY